MSNIVSAHDRRQLSSLNGWFARHTTKKHYIKDACACRYHWGLEQMLYASGMSDPPLTKTVPSNSRLCGTLKPAGIKDGFSLSNRFTLTPTHFLHPFHQRGASVDYVLSNNFLRSDRISGSYSL
jgi:hypothetical protein